MTAPGNDRAPRLAGERGAEIVQERVDFTADSAAIAAETQQIKPEIDVASWAALGGTTKPSRTDRRQKRGWRRQRGMVDASLAAHLLILAVALGLLVAQYVGWPI